MLNAAIAAYRDALDALPMNKSETFVTQTMNVLLARDRLAVALRAAAPTPADMGAVLALDERLKAGAARIDKFVGRQTLVSWREAAQPPTSAWWWRLDELAAAAAPKPNPLWTVAAALCITLSISLLADLARRFLSVGPDAFGAFSLVMQGFLTFLAGRSLTGAGQKNMENLLARLSIDRRYAHTANALVALALLALVLGLRLELPAIARQYNNSAVRAQQQGNITSAIMDYQRAISLSPNYAEAHYNLGTAYEDILALDLAIQSYQTAIRADSHLYPAYNNLAHALMLHQKNYGAALPLLDTALDLKIDLPPEQASSVRYSMLKNRAWANLGQKYLALAESDVQQALAIRPDGAAAHCLRAQILEAQGKNQEALTAWEICLRHEKTDVVTVEAGWLGLARERLSEATK